jgi:hypothetical protein
MKRRGFIASLIGLFSGKTVAAPAKKVDLHPEVVPGMSCGRISLDGTVTHRCVRSEYPDDDLEDIGEWAAVPAKPGFYEKW